MKPLSNQIVTEEYRYTPTSEYVKNYFAPVYVFVCFCSMVLQAAVLALPPEFVK